MAGALGVGPFADIVRRALEREGVDALAEPGRSTATRAFASCWSERGGERAYVYTAGAERRATAADLAALPAENFAFALLGGYAAPPSGEPDIFGDWLERPAARRETDVRSDAARRCGSAAPRVARALARADWISANRREAEALTGEPPERAAPALARGREGALVRDGARGCWLGARRRGGGPRRRRSRSRRSTPPAPATRMSAPSSPRCSPAATPPTAARFANAAAALSVTKLGAATAPSFAETLAFC